MYLVFDVGGTFVKYAVMDKDGNIIEKDKFPTRIMPGDTFEDFVDSLVEVYVQKKPAYMFQGIAMGLPGQIDVANGIVYGGGSLKYNHDRPLAKLLSARCDNLPVSLENDAHCAALAEVWHGNASDCKNAAVLIFGSGIGGAVVVDRHIHSGQDLLAGEISFCYDHVTRKDLANIRPIEEMQYLSDEYDKLPYMWATWNSTRAFCHRVAKSKNLPLEQVNGEKVYEWAAAGDEAVKELLEDYYFDIAKYCCNLYMTLNPDVILIGGGISAQPDFIEGIKRNAEQLKRISNIYKKMKIDVCKFRNDSNLIGALFNFKQLYEKNAE